MIEQFDPLELTSETFPDIQDVQEDSYSGSTGQEPAPVATGTTPQTTARAEDLRSSIAIAQQAGLTGAAEQYQRQLDALTRPAPTVEAAPLPPLTAEQGPPMPLPSTGESQPAPAAIPEQRSGFTTFGPLAIPRAPAPAQPAAPAPEGETLVAEGVNIQYRPGPEGFTYGNTATANARPFRGIVMHHAGIDDLNTAVAYGHRRDEGRGGAFGYHFYIDRDGTVVQAAPLSARTNHIKAPGHQHRRDQFDISNADAVGIAIIGSSDNPTPAQVRAAQGLAAALQSRYGFGTSAIVGHGELQSDRQAGEGATIVRAIRSMNPASFGARADGPLPGIRPDVQAALAEASRRTGVSETYLRNTAGIESSFRPDAAARTTSARGLFQHLDDTWNELVRKYGAELGVPANADRNDPRWSALMGAAYARENQAVLRRSLGRDPTDVELYMAHFLGATGGSQFLQARAQNGSGIAATDFPEAAAQNRPVFFHANGQPKTYDQIMEERTARFNSTPIPRSAAGAIPQRALGEAPPVRLGQAYTEAQAAAERQRAGQQDRGFWELTSAAFQEQTTLGFIQRFDPGPADPSFSLRARPDLMERVMQLPEEYRGRLERSFNEKSFEYEYARAKSAQRLNSDFERAGLLTSLGATVIASMGDPGAWAIAAGTGGVGAAATRIRALQGLAGRPMGAIVGAVGNVGYEVAVNAAQGDDTDVSSLAMAAVLGAGLGAAFGRIGTNPATAADGAALYVAAQREADAIEALSRARAAGQDLDNVAPASAGAARSGYTEPFLKAEDAARLADALDSRVPQQNQWYQKLRFSEGGLLAQSQNPFARGLGALLGVDAVGKADAVNPQSADQLTLGLTRAFTARVSSLFNRGYIAWAEEQGTNRLIAGAVQPGRADFDRLVSQAIRETRAEELQKYSKHVLQTARELSDFFAHRLAEKQDPQTVRGSQGGRPLPGFATVERDPNYLTVAWNRARLRTRVESHGAATVDEMIAAAILREQPQLKEKPALLNKLARAIRTGPDRRMVNAEDDLINVLGKGDAEKMWDILRTDHGWGRRDFEEFMELLGKSTGPEPRPAQDGFKRIRMDYKLRLSEVRGTEAATKGDFAIEDLLETSAETLALNYARHHAGDVALGNIRVFHPETGELLLNGINSDSEFAKLLQYGAQWALDKGGEAVDQWKKDAARLQWLYDTIKGRPHPAVEKMGDVARAMYVARNWNYGRLMGGLGFLTLADTGRIVGKGGLVNFLMHMPESGKIMRMDGQKMLKFGIDREFEAAFGYGTDSFRGWRAQLAFSQEAEASGKGGFMDKAVAVSGRVADLTSRLSLQNYLNSKLELATARIAAQRFADIARGLGKGGELGESDKALIRYLGIDDKMLDRIIGQINKNFTYEKPLLFPGKRRVVDIHGEKWDDGEAYASFMNGIERFVHHVYQKDDFGVAHSVMSHPVAQLFLQFKRFSITAHENQLLHGIANFNPREAATMIWTLFSGVMVYSVQQQLLAIGRSDADKFLEDKGLKLRDDSDLAKLGLTAFSRAGFAGLLPTVIDTGAMFLPYGPLFTERSSGLPSDILLGSPTVGGLKDLASGSRSLISAWTEGTPMTQAEMRTVARALVWQNTMPMAQLFSYMVGDRAPR